MLIILPPSETKRNPPTTGKPLDLSDLSFPELTPLRKRVVKALIDTSRSPDAFERLGVRHSLVADVLRNTELPEVPTRPAIETYSGPLYAGLDPATMSADARRRSGTAVVICSALWGALRPDDQIPAYRLHACARLTGLDRLEPMWRTLLPQALARAAGPHGVVLDLRSPAYQALGKPAGAASRTVTLRVLPESDKRTIGDVIAKRIRGEVARYLLECESQPGDTDELADVLGQRWPVRLDPPAGPSQAWIIRLRPRD